MDPDSFGDVFRNKEFLQQGEFISEGETGVVIGNELAEFFDLEVGDFYTLRFQDAGDSFNTLEGEVVGIISTPDPEVNSQIVFTSREQVLPALRLDDGKTSQIMVRIEDKDMAPSLAEELNKKLASTNFLVRSYEDVEEFIVYGQQWNNIQMYVMLAFFLLLGVIGVFNLIVLGAIERVEEIGMMKAMGMKVREIVRIFVLEAVGIGLIGALVGCIVGGIGVFLFNTYGISAELTGWEDLELFAIEGSKIYGAWNPVSFLVISVLILIVVIVASIIPAYWAASKDPVKAIHHR